MRSMVEGALGQRIRRPSAPSVGFAATSPVKNGGGSAKCDRSFLRGAGDTIPRTPSPVSNP